jgi:hypothetical protein
MEMTTYFTLSNEIAHRNIPVSDEFMIDRHGYRVRDQVFNQEGLEITLPENGAY